MADQLPEQPVGGLISHVFPSLAGGELTALGGSPAVTILRHADLTISTSGVTLSQNVNPGGGGAINGLNRLVVDQSANSTFYAAGGRFSAYYSAGTLAGVSLVGQTIMEWSTVVALLDRLVGPLVTVLTDGGNTATTFKTDLPVATTNQYKDAWLYFEPDTTTVELRNQVKRILSSVAATDFVAMHEAYTTVPQPGDRARLVRS